jgi:hypothetical protein
MHPPHSAGSTPQGSRRTAQHLQRSRSSQVALAGEDVGSATALPAMRTPPQPAAAAPGGGAARASGGGSRCSGASNGGVVAGGGGGGEEGGPSSQTLSGGTRLAAVGSTRLCTEAVLQASGPSAPHGAPARNPAHSCSAAAPACGARRSRLCGRRAPLAGRAPSHAADSRGPPPPGRDEPHTTKQTLRLNPSRTLPFPPYTYLNPTASTHPKTPNPTRCCSRTSLSAARAATRRAARRAS